ncbi:hypothetical protein [Chryseobacterium sp. IHB B 17019]|uniref:hypothetical protein n=1 Tax=Chryseobacterium sp. IHB B 17019 TaxID=1721091 RepID=UPI0012376360|nr:hypothetical protein [Chryseobacterium sp. IHB B 17019]
MNPIALKRGIQKAIQQVPKLIDETIKESNLEDINRDNLLQGKDSEGNDMPFYSPNSEYGFEKMRRNPKNRGRWDLRNTGEYHRGIYTEIKRNQVLFKQRVRNAKAMWIARAMERANRISLGIPQTEMDEILIEKAPEIKKKIERIITSA